ncbi:MAG TPA: diacylglycerol kinase family protein [Candidatus Cybelea sp.]|nr:diacylglycerol kinase family protein [Candidatus Cybelea sp.]
MNRESRPDIFIIVNPAAGRGEARRQAAAVRDYLGSKGRGVELAESHNSEDVRAQAARAARNGCPCVLALGGDGTFHHLAEGILGTGASAGFLPAGNGNDVARALGIPADPIRAADALLHSRVRVIDLVRARFPNGHVAHSICVGGIGLDAQAAHLANTRFRAWPGTSRYLAGALLTYFEGAAFELHADMDGRGWHGRALFAVAANAPQYGSGLRIAPGAQIDDGWLDLVIVRELAWTRVFEAIPILLTSGDLRFPEVEKFRSKRVLLETDRPVKVHGDGEILGESPVEFEVVPGALRVLAPEGRPSSSR